MSKKLILGNSLAVVKRIEDIRREDQDSEIALFCTESVLPYDRLSLPALVAGQIKESQTHPLPEDFFKANKVEVIANEKLLRISLKRKYLTTDSKKQIDYDELLIADLGGLTPLPIKGHQKKGVFGCSLLTSIKDLIKYLPYADTIFVMVSNIYGFNMACALASLGKDIVIISSGSVLLPELLDEETGVLLKQVAEGKGIRVIMENTIEEVLGEGEVKAVKLQSGKVIACQMVVADFMPLDWRLVEDDSGYQRIEDEFFQNHLPCKAYRFGFKVMNGFCTGITKLPQGGREYLKFDGPGNVFKKIFAQGDVLVGAVLFNAPSYEQELLKVINEHVPVAGREEVFLGGQG